MPLLITNYVFYTRLLEKLDSDFEVKLRSKTPNGDLMFKTDRGFLYSNIMPIIRVNNTHNLVDLKYNRFENLQVQKTNYDREIILMNIAIIASSILEESIKPYMAEIKGYDDSVIERDIDILVAKNNAISLEKRLTKTFDKSFIVSFKELDYIKYLFNRQQFFPLADIYFENNTRYLKKLLNKKVYSKKTKLYNYKAKINLSDEFINSKVYKNKSLNNVIDEAFNDAYLEIEKYLKGLLL